MTAWLNAREAAAYLRVAHRTVLRWAAMGRIPAHKLSGAKRITYRFSADDLDSFLRGEIEMEQSK